MLRTIFSLVMFTISALPLLAQSQPLQKAYEDAEKAIAPWIVRIETIGGREKVGDELTSDGATTGVLLDAEGHIVSSAFNFMHEPSSILVRLSDGTKKVAKQLAVDHSRMLTLLKVENIELDFLKNAETTDGIAVPHVSKNEIKLGQWAIALGAALSNEESNISVGIISGKDRIWGKAIQTDAAVSPNNYGGPLVDLRGRVMGILAPLSMMSDEVTGGAELYDGGVGMAVTIDELIAALPKLKQGISLYPCKPGFAFKQNALFTGRAVVETVPPNSPAVAAGLKPGDLVVKINGQEVSNALKAEIILRRLYAGDEIELTYKRDGAEATAKWKSPEK